MRGFCCVSLSMHHHDRSAILPLICASGNPRKQLLSSLTWIYSSANIMKQPFSISSADAANLPCTHDDVQEDRTSDGFQPTLQTSLKTNDNNSHAAVTSSKPASCCPMRFCSTLHTLCTHFGSTSGSHSVLPHLPTRHAAKGFRQPCIGL